MRLASKLALDLLLQTSSLKHPFPLLQTERTAKFQLDNHLYFRHLQTESGD